jgi:hypothetical protein
VDVKHQPPPQMPYPSTSHPGPSMPLTSVYHYINPVTHDHVASLLPPDHPEMICLQAGGHITETRFGILGAFMRFTATLSTNDLFQASLWPSSGSPLE